MEKNNETPAEKSTSDNAGAGSVGETTSIIERADKAAERLEKAISQQTELLSRHEAVLARQLLGGRAAAGAEIKIITQEEKDNELAKKLIGDYYKKI